MRIEQIKSLSEALSNIGLSWIPKTPKVAKDVDHIGSDIGIIIYNESPDELRWVFRNLTGVANVILPSVKIVLPAADATNPYAVLIGYDYVSDTIYFDTSTPAVVPTKPVLPDNIILIARFEISATTGTVGNVDQSTIDFDIGIIDTPLPNITPDTSPVEVSDINQLGAILKGLDNDTVFKSVVQEITAKKYFSSIVKLNQNIDVVGSNEFVFSGSGNFGVISNSITELRRISNLDSDGVAITGGTPYFLDVKKEQVIKHLYGASGVNRNIRLHTVSDWTAGRDTLLCLVYDSLRDLWIVLGDALSDLVSNSFNFNIVPINLKGYGFASTFNVLGDFSTVNSATNEGTATILDIQPTYIEFSTGTFFGLKTFDASLVQINEIVGCENQIALPYLHCGITGNAFLVSEVKTVITQDTYMYVQRYGSVNMTSSGGYEITIPLKTDLTKIYN